MREEMTIFENEELEMVLRVRELKDGSISFNAEDVAKGLGITTVAKSGNVTVRWKRMMEYLKEFGYENQIDRDSLIPEYMFYLLAMKANNDTAKKFQMWIATQVMPSIRKHGAFIADSDNVDENYVRNELRFSQKRTIKSFSNAKVGEVKQLYSEFRDYVDEEYKYKTDDRLARYKSVEKGLQQLHDDLARDPENVGDCYNIRKLKECVILDRTTLEKRISGGIRASQTRMINELQEELEELRED